MHSIQARYPPPIQQNMVPQQTGPYVSHPIDPGFHQYGPGGPGPRVAPFGDMTNNQQYLPPRGVDSRGSIPRRPSYVNKASGLYNPYGTERPDKAGFAKIPQQPNGRKPGRQSSSDVTGRGRNYSTSFGSQPFDRESNARPSGHFGDASYPRSTYTRINHEVVNDISGGCSQDRIGPNNNTVQELHVKNLPHEVTKEELASIFQQRGKVKPKDVSLRLNPGGDCTHAFVYFSSTADARQGLSVNGKTLRGRPLVVSVPNRYWKYPDTPTLSFEGQIPDFHAQGGTRVSSYSSHSPTDTTVALNTTVQYSPQDARSDLRRIGKQQQEYPTTRGSPEARKSKRQASPSVQDASGSKEQPRIDEVMGANDKLGAIPEQAPVVPIDAEQPTSAERARSKQHMEQAAGPMEPTVATNLSKDVVIDQSAMLSTEEEVVAEKIEAEPSKPEPLQSASLKDTEPEGPISVQSTPQELDSLSAAKVALPPVVDAYKAFEEPPVSQDAAVKKEGEVASQPSDSTATMRTQEDTASDDDQKNDLSFHSAKESQSDAGNNGRKGETNPHAQASEEPPAPVTNEATLAESQHAGPEPASEEPDAVETKAGAANQTPTDEGVSILEKPSSDVGKKVGAKQTQSLFPFAKPSKTQAKKDKQAKKKDKKKGKGKAEKEVPTASHSEEFAVTDPAVLVSGASSKLDDPAEPTDVGKAMVNSEKPTTRKTDNEEKSNKNTESSLADAVQGTAVNARESEEVGGKQSRSPARAVLETQTLEAQHSTMAQKAMQKQSDDASSGTSVPFLSEVPDSAGLPQSEPSMVGPQQFNGKEESGKRTKAAPHRIVVPAIPAVPDLRKLPNRGPSPTNKPGALDTTSSISPTGSSKDAPRTNHAGDDSAVIAPASLDAASVRSSPTLRALSPPPLLASPTASNFYTPAQTPSGIGPPPSAIGPPPHEPTKKKKNKKKKKAASKQNDTGNETTAAEDAAKEPFYDQFSQIDSIKSANQSGSYYLRGAQEAAEKDSRSEDKDPRNLFQSVHAYVKEKVDTYARLPEKSWSTEGRRIGVPLKPNDAEKLINEERGVVIRLARDSNLQDDDPRKVEKAELKPLFHD
ncbi:hypothetical protein K458DRAFT_129548 [Lentithecium fluviatile CBS 122367]|uniref:RRM domain-containing protein n=1 Tax=Lentithecium fluviatile CBS 122367 TaxID=1168545 RepID=A0A6G1JG76_9PLEO|nr:hypothetical protein K458DRAFT_129548 [Lentithecium fluviatile CBS 122367]